MSGHSTFQFLSTSYDQFQAVYSAAVVVLVDFAVPGGVIHEKADATPTGLFADLGNDTEPEAVRPPEVEAGFAASLPLPSLAAPGFLVSHLMLPLAAAVEVLSPLMLIWLLRRPSSDLDGMGGSYDAPVRAEDELDFGALRIFMLRPRGAGWYPLKGPVSRWSVPLPLGLRQEPQMPDDASRREASDALDPSLLRRSEPLASLADFSVSSS